LDPKIWITEFSEFSGYSEISVETEIQKNGSKYLDLAPKKWILKNGCAIQIFGATEDFNAME